MPLLTPHGLKDRKPRAKKERKLEEAISHSRGNFLKSGEKRSHGRKKRPLIINGLCKEARILKGSAPIPRYMQEATVQLYLHLWDGKVGRKKCQLCDIPSRPPLNDPRQQLQLKLEKMFGKKMDQIANHEKINRSDDQMLFDALMSKALHYENLHDREKMQKALTEARKVQDRMKELEDTYKVIKGIDFSLGKD